jgi:hypothetical protein
MLEAKAQIESARSEIRRSYGLSPYEAVDVAWVSIIKLSNLLPDTSEHKRLLSLLERLPSDSVSEILQLPAIDTLLNLHPPLESVLSVPHERLDAERTAKELAAVRANRHTSPEVALQNLAEVLKRIRNRRAHGFKTSEGPRC